MCAFVMQTIEDLLLTIQRNSRARSRWERKQQSMVKKNEEAQQALEKAKAEIQRLEVGWLRYDADSGSCLF